jgi:hypothetical protein
MRNHAAPNAVKSSETMSAFLAPAARVSRTLSGVSRIMNTALAT